MNKKILVTGGEGRFSKVLRRNNKKLNLIFKSKKELDILNYNSLKKIIKKIRPKIILHTAGLSRPMNIHEENISKSIDLNIVGTCNIVCNEGRFLRKEEMRCEDIVSKCLVGEELDRENNMCIACPQSPENSEYFDGCQWRCKEGFEMHEVDGNAFFCKKIVEQMESPSHEDHDHSEMQAGAQPCMEDPNSSECLKFMESMQRSGNDPSAPGGTQTYDSQEEAEAAANRDNFDPGMLSDEEHNQGLADVARQKELEGENMPKAEEGQPSSECESECNGNQECMASCMGDMNMGYEPGQTRDDLEKPDMSGVSEEEKERMKIKGMSEEEFAMFERFGGDPDAVDDATRERMTRGMDESEFDRDSSENQRNRDMFEIANYPRDGDNHPSQK